VTRPDKESWRRPPKIEPMAPPPRHRRWRRRFAALGTAAVLLTTIPLFIDMPLRLMWNASASVPRGLYIVTPAVPRRGDLAVVRPQPSVAHFMDRRRYVPLGIPLLKPVAAVSGATVCRVGRDVTVDGAPLAMALRADRVGRPLPVWSGCHHLGRGELFLLAGASPASFDSRYFGPVAAGDVVGRAVPLWTVS
jgi:conjugative transfer signal peptidase TraF